MNAILGFIEFLYKLFVQPINLGGISISVSSIVVTLVALIFTIFISRYLSNWLRDKLLVRLGVKEGTREAIATIFRYFTIALAFIVVPQAAGLDIRSISFLAGGLGLGIGFGFQRLAQNFVSGLILLLEQPIKVGDYIELGNLEGTIRKISIRSTLLVTNDSITIIVPNSDLVDNRIVNWSHGNINSRIHLPIRVAYGSDPFLVKEVLLDAAQRESRVLSQPTPQVWLDSFGDHSINYELLVWIDQPRARLPIQSSLNYIIQNGLRQRRIEIPTAQRDLRIRNIEDLKGVFESARSAPSEPILKPEASPISEEESTNQYPENLSLKKLLREVVYFESFSDLELLNLIEKGCRQTFKNQAFIFREGDPGDAFHIILSGSVEVLSEKANKHIRDLYAGDFFGELALMMGIPRSASIRALETTVVFVVSRDVFQSFLSSYPKLADQIAQKLAERNQELMQRRQMLKDMGILDSSDLEHNPFVWIRKRMRLLFNI
ncbi:MAG: mechanosensitive ion channel domain-containing protein [Microcoleaceae cyanobacterium]